MCSASLAYLPTPTHTHPPTPLAGPPAPPCAVVPHPNATGFALVRSDLAGSVYGLPRQTFEVPKLFPLPRSGVVVDSPLWDSVLLLGPVGPFKDGQLDATRVSGGCGGAGESCSTA